MCFFNPSPYSDSLPKEQISFFPSEITTECINATQETALRSSEVKNQRLEIYGKNIFFSQIIQMIENQCSENAQISEVHIMGVNVYVDTNITLHGKNLAIGSENLEFSCKRDVEGPISIDLSGKEGKSSSIVHTGRAASGINPCEDGCNGMPGGDGEGGEPGGDLCIMTQNSIVGIENLKEFNLSGGNGGRGSDGQAGGHGASGVRGEDARSSIESVDPSGTTWGHLDLRRGAKGRPGGSGGKGGDAGIGGQGAVSGNLLTERISEDLKILIHIENGKEGTDGIPGEGGKGGKGKPDGSDLLIAKGGFLEEQHRIIGYELYCQNPSNDRDMNSWASQTDREATIQRNQGREKGRGKTVEEQTRSRKEQRKHDLAKGLFETNLANHLNQELLEDNIIIKLSS